MARINNRSKEFIIKHRDILVCLFLVMATFAVYWQVHNFDFVNFDDPAYVYENRYVQEGLTLDSIIWAFSFSEKKGSYWHPVSWLSHMLDYQLYELRPGKHHLTSLIIHIANSLLLFIVFKSMTGAFWKSAFVAMLFAIHPINVDSVAWITERKNVLSTFFWMLTMLAYVYYSKQPVLYRYLLTFFVFALGLMAKPMLVTLPCVLLLLDYWPLGRFSYGPSGGNKNGKTNKIIISGSQGFSTFRLVLEKIPFLALSVLSICLSSFLVKGKVTESMSFVPMKLRIANALVSYVKYIGKMIWPQDIAVLYPFPRVVQMWQTIGALFLLVGVSVFMIRSIRRAPCLIIGWLWYLGTLVPVIGLVQVGLWPAMADRFAYVPLIGLFIVISWGIPELVAQWRYRKIWLATLATVVLTILMAMTWKQVGYWENSITLFEHTLKITSNNYLPHNNLGLALYNQGRTAEAIEHYLQALRIKPDYEKAHSNLGVALDTQGRTAEAIEHYLQALRIKPDYVDAHNNLGLALYNQGRTAEAIEHYLQALRIKPDYVDAHNNLGVALNNQGRTAEAIEHYLQILGIKPDYEKAHYNLGVALDEQGRTAEAIQHYLQALRIKPDYVEAHNNLGIALFRKGNIEGAIAHFRKALRINPNNIHAKNNLKKALMMQQQNQ
jgi:tetratricopeptide (TPR) repeat protein